MYDKANDLITQYKDVPKIFFHCALSQVRGPKSARIYSETINNLGVETDQKVRNTNKRIKGI